MYGRDLSRPIPVVFSVPTIRADPAAAKQAEVPIRVKKRAPTIKKDLRPIRVPHLRESAIKKKSDPT